MLTVTLKPDRHASLLRKHPWVFSGSIDQVDGNPDPGDTVRVVTCDGDPLGVGMYSPSSQIRVRMWSFNPETAVDEAFFRAKIESALALRRDLGLLGEPSAAARLVHSESDGLPGLIVDRYADVLVCQFLTAGAAKHRDTLARLLGELSPARSVVERSDSDVLAREGLEPQVGVLAGEAAGEVEITEPAGKFGIDVLQGHKTGFYLDQRENRAAVMRLSRGRDVLNAFAYTGGFGVAALNGGATHVTNLDTSGDALALAAKNFARNGADPARVAYEEADAFHQLRRYRDSRRAFDLIVLDPPKFAETKAQIDGACRGYKDINLLAFKLLRPGGLLFTFSCSGAIYADLFQKVVAGAALDSGRDAKILARMTQGPDHPVLASYPEGDYLKGLVLRVE